MWWIKGNKDSSRGGFQDRDVGRSNFGHDFGPEYGPDYARFSDPPDLAADAKLSEMINFDLIKHFPIECEKIRIRVRNGFVLVEGEVSDPSIRVEVADMISKNPEVKEVINQLHYPSLQ